MNQVYVGGSYFHIYTSILKSLNRPDKNTKSLLILNDHTPGIAGIIPRLKEAGYFDHVIQVPFVELKKRIRKEQTFLSRIFNRNKFTLEYVEENSSIVDYDDFIRNSEINLFYNLGLCPYYFLIKYNKNFIRLVEDGEHNYNPRIGWFKAFRRKYLLNTPVGEGFDPEIREIEVQHVNRLNERVRHKGKTLELQAMQTQLTQEEHAKILNLFLSDQPVNVSAGKNLLLITQPWSEDHQMDEAGKVEMYNQMLEAYSSDHAVFIKPHPRDLTDYQKKIRVPFTEIPRAFPLEMLDFLKNIRFKRGVTISSSALHNIKCVEEKIFLGNEHLKWANENFSA